MTYTNLLPRTETITGAQLSGVSGAQNRTYTLSYAGVLSSGIQIIVQGAPLIQGPTYDFVVVGQVVTFLNSIDDAWAIQFTYFTTVAISGSSPLVTTTNLRYATPMQLAGVLGMRMDVPTADVGSQPVKELVGTGDNSNGTFYLAHRNIISDTYTIYYGATSATTTTLTEITHYMLDKDKGQIILTTAGIAFLGTNKIYAEYSYYGVDLKNSYVIEVLGRAESQVDGYTNTTFTNGTATNPNYPVQTELRDSQGRYHRTYQTSLHPIIDVVSSLNGSMDASQVTIPLPTGDGAKYPSSGLVIIDREIMAYTSVVGDTLSGVSRAQHSTAAATHASGASIHTTIVEISSQDEGNPPAWYSLAWDSEVSVDELGRIYLFRDQLIGGIVVTPTLMPVRDVADRLKATYYYGHDSVPVDITRLTILLAKRMLITDNIGAAMIKGRNEFQPQMLNADKDEIDQLTDLYRALQVENT